MTASQIYIRSHICHNFVNMNSEHWWYVQRFICTKEKPKQKQGDSDGERIGRTLIENDWYTIEEIHPFSVRSFSFFIIFPQTKWKWWHLQMMWSLKLTLILNVCCICELHSSNYIFLVMESKFYYFSAYCRWRTVSRILLLFCWRKVRCFCSIWCLRCFENLLFAQICQNA